MIIISPKTECVRPRRVHTTDGTRATSPMTGMNDTTTAATPVPLHPWPAHP
jgi:hypothetical protein